MTRADTVDRRRARRHALNLQNLVLAGEGAAVHISARN